MLPSGRKWLISCNAADTNAIVPTVRHTCRAIAHRRCSEFFCILFMCSPGTSAKCSRRPVCARYRWHGALTTTAAADSVRRLTESRSGASFSGTRGDNPQPSDGEDEQYGEKDQQTKNRWPYAPVMKMIGPDCTISGTPRCTTPSSFHISFLKIYTRRFAFESDTIVISHVMTYVNRTVAAQTTPIGYGMNDAAVTASQHHHICICSAILDRCAYEALEYRRMI
ncbi:hypothetical protein OKW37_000596 [Paraburkholderia sp. MM5482-R2]